MDFEFKATPLNELSEIVEFKWMIGLYSTTPQLFLFRNGHIHQDHEFYDKRVSIKVGLRKTEVKKCDVHTLLLFEIQNCERESYWKDSMEEKFSELNEVRYSSKNIEIPTRGNEVVRGLYKDMCFPDPVYAIILGKIFFQCCREKNVPELLSRNTGQLQSDLKDLFQSKTYADVSFHIGDTAIPAHKNILCSRSVVFKTMFEQKMKEADQNAVEITDIEKSVFEVFLVFLYTGTLQEKKLDVVMPLYSVADKYAVETLLITCSDFLFNSISEATAVSILSLADMHNYATLKVAATDFIYEHFAAVESTDSWDGLLNSDPRLASFVLKQISTTAAKNATE